MKKLLSIILSLFLIVAISCDVNKPLRQKMIKYYSNNENYQELFVELKSIEIIEEIDELRVIVKVLSGNNEFIEYSSNKECEFVLVNSSKMESIVRELQVNDTFYIVSAPMYFYNGHILPILSIRHKDNLLLLLEEGKDNYLGWVNEKFS